MSHLITTAIDYTNGAPHIGHAYEKVLTDTLARWRVLRGDLGFRFMTGVDQHGQKVQQSAQRQGLEPAEYVAQITQKFIDLWALLGVDYDIWAATTDPRHVKCVQGILQKLWDDGHFYKASQKGHYSVRQEQFVTDKERQADGTFGPEWGEVVEIEEENYYFKLAAHRDWLLALIDKREREGRPFVLPAFRNAELRNAVEKMTGDLCISRPKTRLEWGIEIPFDRDYVTYVWFDALTNYISFAGYEPSGKLDTESTEATENTQRMNVKNLCDSSAASAASVSKSINQFDELWPAVHVIGKDILVPPHGIYWPIMLRACGFTDEQMPTLLVHGWWNIAGEKMSKSLGNIVDPAELANTYGVDATRYYLLADIATGRDADFSNERLVTRYNSELANSLGNLLNRTLNMAKRYRGSVLRKPSDSPLAEFVTQKCEEFASRMEAYEVHLAIEAANAIAYRANAYVEETAPWKLAKEETETAVAKLDEVLYSLAETLRIISVLMDSIIPKAAAAMRDQLAWNADISWNSTTWGLLPDNHRLADPVPVFPRIESASSGG